MTTRITLLTDSSADIFGIYVDGRLVYNYDWANLDEILEAIATAIGATFDYQKFEADGTYTVPDNLSELI